MEENMVVLLPKCELDLRYRPKLSFYGDVKNSEQKCVDARYIHKRVIDGNNKDITSIFQLLVVDIARNMGV